jgi:hypothetical protein
MQKVIIVTGNNEGLSDLAEFQPSELNQALAEGYMVAEVVPLVLDNGRFAISYTLDTDLYEDEDEEEDNDRPLYKPSVN